MNQLFTNELAATLSYGLALVDFEALQQAGPDDAPAASPAAVSATTSPTSTTSREQS